MKMPLGVKIAAPVVVLGFFAIIMPIVNVWHFDNVARPLMSGGFENDQFINAVTKYHYSVMFFSLLIGGIGMSSGVVISYRLIMGLRPFTARLKRTAEFIGKQSKIFAISSEEIARGTGEQAVSLEETSSALEEIASMVARNAGNAQEANSLMQANQATVREAERAMKEMAVSITEITSSGRETSKIVKTIDEIAFQTNLLALNAAVEAARAGEAGQGFAVVAEEVRNLAMRAAEAARNTANLIDETSKKIQDGSALVARTEEAFSSVTQGAGKVAGLIAEIAGASQEQSNGINQLNQTVSNMDKVVQTNAGHAEDNSSMAKDLKEEGADLERVVGQLIELMNIDVEKVQGMAGQQKSLKTSGAAPWRTSSSRPDSGQAKAQALLSRPPRKKEAKPGSQLKGSRPKEQSAPPAAKEQKKPAEVIPFDDDDFEDF
jgi:methyl-accepting chemotaxis protein